MAEYPYVIVGGGMAADAAIRGIRRRDASGPIAVLPVNRFPRIKSPPYPKSFGWTSRPNPFGSPNGSDRQGSISG